MKFPSLPGHLAPPWRQVVLAALLLSFLALITYYVTSPPPVRGVSTSIVISQVYGAGGNSGATLRNDYVELFNRSASPQSLNGLSLQYGSSSGNFASSSGNLFVLPNVTLQPGQYFLFAGNSGGSNGSALTADATQTSFSMAAGSGKVALVNATTALNCGGATTCTATQLAAIIDAVAYGSQTGSYTGEGGTQAPGLSATTAALRAANGCTDTDSNSADFTAGAPSPRNTGSPLAPCSSGGGLTLSINDVTQAEGDSGTTDFNFTVSLSSPAGVGGVSFTVNTADGTATAGTDYVAIVNGSGSIAQGSSSTTVTVQVNGDTTAEPNETFFVNLTNVTGATVADGQGLGTITNDDVTITPIYTIQGSGSTSPLAGQAVTTTGIVTGIKSGSSGGFFLQDPVGDGDPNTSDGIFVFTGSSVPAGAVIGNGVRVSGTVQEFVPSSDPNSPPATEISGTLTVSVLSTGNPLPAPHVITAAETTAPSGTTNPLDSLEEFEGMRVSVPSLTVVAPTQGTVNEANATSTSNGVFYGVVTGVARPFREPGINRSDPLPAGSPANVPRFDENPERLRVDSDAQPGTTALEVTTGAVVTNLVGPLDYAFRTYTILPDAATPPTVSGNVSATPVPAPAANEFTVASFNMERFYDTTDDPGTSDVVLTTTAFNNRLNKASLAIRQVLLSPDIIGVEEMENLTTLQAVAARVNSDAVAAGQPDPNYQAYLVEGNDVGGIDVGFLVKASRVNVIDVTQWGKTDTYINPNNGLPETLNDRPPLILRATVQPASGPAVPVTVIVNHLRSLSGINDPVDGNRIRAKRRAQAEFLANLIQARQTSDPTEKIISVGDYNSFQFNDGYVDVIGTVKGQPTPADQVVLASSDLVNPDLYSASDSIAASGRYSFSFDGNAQALDHILITSNLTPLLTRFAYARFDADFPEAYRGDPTRPERISDHDAPVAYFALGPTAVGFVSFTATSFTGGVYLHWEAAFEAGNLGFNLYREQGGQLAQLNPSLILGLNSQPRATALHAYSWWDAQGGAGAQYWLEEVGLRGNLTPRGPAAPEPGKQFYDVPQSHPFYLEVSKLAAMGITGGCGDGNFCADAPVTREQAAVLIERALGLLSLPEPSQPRFLDVPVTRWSAGFIEDFARRGITSGCGGRNYCPDGEVTREQIAVLLDRALGVLTPPPPPSGQQTFGDVPAARWSYAFVEDFARRGITGGCGGGNYCPDAPVTRGQIAAFLVRAFQF